MIVPERPIVLVDMDGVLADFDGKLLDFWREKHPDLPYIPLEERNTFYASDQYPEEFSSLMKAIVRSEGFFFSLPPIPRALEAMQILSERAEVFICTAPLISSHYCIYEKLLWVERHLGRKWLRRTIISKDKTLVHGRYLIDDKPVISGVCEPVWEHIIFNAPYNRGVPDKRRLDWKDFRTVLKELF